MITNCIDKGTIEITSIRVDCKQYTHTYTLEDYDMIEQIE